MREVQLIQTLYFNAWRWKFLLIVAGICATIPEGLHSSFENTPACERQNRCDRQRKISENVRFDKRFMASTILSVKKKRTYTTYQPDLNILTFFAEEIDIQSSLKVNLIIVYYSAQYKSCGMNYLAY